MTHSLNILIVDDDEEIRTLLADFLGQHHMQISLAEDGDAMKACLQQQKFDLMILDVMLPGEDGLTLCRKVRAHSNMPIIMLTAMGEDTDRIIGLEIGADDYIAKPFNPRELLARIKAILRRTTDEEPKRQQSVVKFSNWTFDLDGRRLISPDDLEVTLSAGEYDLLVVFVKQPKVVLSRDQLLDLTKNRSAGPFDRSIDVQISRIRQKIETQPKNPQLIKTVRGGGYVFTSDVTSA